MSPTIIIILIICISILVYRIFLRKNKCDSDYCEDTRAKGITRAKMNLDPKWNSGCVRDPKTGHFKRK